VVKHRIYCVYILRISIREGTVSVGMSMLAMLDERAMYGLELKHEFEERTGGVWPLNVGQVYTTLGRLERDGFVRRLEDPGDGSKIYEITDEGRTRVAEWFAEPSRAVSEVRDDTVLKIAIAASTPGIEAQKVLQTERRHLIEQLQEYTRLKSTTGSKDLGWLLMIDSLVFRAEARVRWLDACEARIARAERSEMRSAVESPAQEEVAR
jgi:DNA-binding PadR family transcriptional regulator